MNSDTTFAPFLVRAHLSSGLAHASPWGIALDGILAAELWADHKAGALDCGEYVPALSPQATPPDLELPLARCTLAGAAWHWCATCSFPEDPAGDPVVRHWASRTDHRGLEELAASDARWAGPVLAALPRAAVTKAVAVQIISRSFG
ncbi:hypothetical protein LQL77_29380 [Rhodococcus cerastii]|nr:hypothetical protein [Rhodococcus cerastii]